MSYLSVNTFLQLDENVKEFRKENANMQMEGKYAQLETRKHDEEMKLVKDVASMKSKISELERKLSEVRIFYLPFSFYFFISIESGTTFVLTFAKNICSQCPLWLSVFTWI